MKYLILMLFISTSLFATDLDNYINYKTAKEYKNYTSQGQIEIRKTPTSFTINTNIGKDYILFLSSTDVVEIAIYDGSFSDVRRYSGRGILKFKAQHKTAMIVVESKGSTIINWGTY